MTESTEKDVAKGKTGTDNPFRFWEAAQESQRLVVMDQLREDGERILVRPGSVFVQGKHDPLPVGTGDLERRMRWSISPTGYCGLKWSRPHLGNKTVDDAMIVIHDKEVQLVDRHVFPVLFPLGIYLLFEARFSQQCFSRLMPLHNPFSYNESGE